MNKIKNQIDESYLSGLTEEEQIAVKSNWTPAQIQQYLCPNGTHTLEEFRQALCEAVDKKIMRKVLSIFGMSLWLSLCAVAQDNSWMNPFVVDSRLNGDYTPFGPNKYKKPFDDEKYKYKVLEVELKENTLENSYNTLERYDTLGRLLCHVEKTNSSYEGWIRQLELYEYDEKGRIIGICAFRNGSGDGDEGNYIFSSYEYDEAKKTVRCLKYHPIDGLGTTILSFKEALAIARKGEKPVVDEYRVVNVTMRDGSLRQRFIYGKLWTSSYYGQWDEMTGDTLTLTVQKKSGMTTTTITKSDHLGRTSFSIDTFYYNASRKHVKRVEVHRGWSEFVTEYDQQGNKSSYTYSYSNNSFQEKTTYNTNGDIAHKTCYNHGKITQEFEYSYWELIPKVNWEICKIKEKSSNRKEIDTRIERSIRYSNHPKFKK